MTQIIDRRLSGKNKSAVNRQRFIRRYKSQIKKAVGEAISGRSITDIDRGEKISIPTRDLAEPAIGHGRGGRREGVNPGNTDFVSGDQVERPPGAGGGQGNEASDQGEGEDEFAFNLSREEFLELFFEDLALPDLVKTQLAKMTDHKSVRAGHTPNGIPSNIDVVRSLKGSLARRIALSAPYREALKEVNARLEALRALRNPDAEEIKVLEEEAARLKKRIDAIPFIDTFDLRYRNRVRQAVPSTQAVMFCLMDVSGSMDEHRKDIAKRFFILLYLFLTRHYERIQLVFIRHHTVAMEVNEEDFFYARETGGTVVSSALELMYDIIKQRYPTADWNIYAAQASDGDNWNDDSPLCREMLLHKIMPCLQYFAYVEIEAKQPQNLWEEYQLVDAAYQNFAMQRIHDLPDIYPVFRQLFKKQPT